MTSEIYMNSTHMKVLKDVGFLYMDDKDGNIVRIVYQE